MLFYETVKEVKEGDIILHISKRDDIADIRGFSIAKEDWIVTSEKPPKPDDWETSKEFYRVKLKNFNWLEEPINLKKLC